MKRNITKIRIYDVRELAIGDVLFIYEKRQKDLNDKRAMPLPMCNFYRLTVVTSIDPYNNGKTYGCKETDILTSDNGDHKILADLLADNEILKSGSGVAQIDEHREVYRLKFIRSRSHNYTGSINLYKNPGYDLMH
jgi:hypothetical protein